MMACEHVCGSTTQCVQNGSLWNRTLVKGACSCPSLLNMFFAAVINVAYTRVKVDKDNMNALVHPGTKPGVEVREGATAGKRAQVTSVWGILHVDDAGVVVQSPE